MYAKKRRTGGEAEATLFGKLTASAGRSLANANARETTFAFDTNLAAGEQVSDGGDGFLGVLRAGADGDDEVAEGELLSGLQNLGVLFHWVVPR